MSDLDAKLALLAEVDPGLKRTLLGDLAELLSRHGYAGTDPNYAFDDPEIGALPVRLEDGQIRRIAEAVGPLLLDDAGAEDLRATAAWVLGKTHVPEGLAMIVRAVAAPGRLPREVARQCAFAFDPMAETCNAAALGVDLDALGSHFERHGIPWDVATRRVVVDEL